MIRAIDEALEARGRESRDHEVEQLWDKVDDAHKVITSLGSKVEALEAENASLSSKLERVDHALKSAWKSVSGCLADLPNFPCRVDEMTERETRIAEPVSFCVGTLKFLYEYLDNERAALAETSEEKSESTACGRIKD